MQTQPEEGPHRMFTTIREGVSEYQGWSAAKQRACTQYLADSARSGPKIRPVGERPVQREKPEKPKS